MRLNRSWLQKATDADLVTMHDNVEAQIDELMIGMLDDTNNPIPVKLSALELEVDVIKGEIALRQIESKKPVEVAAVEPKTAVILQFKPRVASAAPPVQASESPNQPERA